MIFSCSKKRFDTTPLFRRASEGFPHANLVTALVVAVLSLSVLAHAQTAKYPQTIVFMTDFGLVDDSVAICRGVMYSIMPEVRIVDLTHQVRPFSILDGARFLYGATPYYPAGTVFVAVIDPGVGTPSHHRKVETWTVLCAA